MTPGDGDGWVTCGLGHRHWGRYGAAGLLVRSQEQVILQHRAAWSHQGDTWGPPGGAMDSHESTVDTALREAAEEAGIESADVRVTGVHVEDHGGWSYSTVLARPCGDLRPRAVNAESVVVDWQPVADLGRLALHPGFAAAWPLLAAIADPPTIVVDAANVMGARADGWWRDRAAAAVRLHAAVGRWADAGLGPGVLPEDRTVHRLRLPAVVLVLEGAARDADLTTADRVTVIRAAGSGDDAVVAAVGDGGPAVVVTADRELRGRVGRLGATSVGPRWLLDQL